LKQVACKVYKNEIADIAVGLANGVKPGNPGYIPVFQAAVTELMERLGSEELAELEVEKESWKKEGPPEEVKRKMAENNGLKFLRTSVETQHREMGMRSIIWESHKNKAGDSLVQM
jgi:hypothetical protein